jgi:hypothetical protein
MKCLVFDSGPVISFALNNLLSLLPYLKKRYKGLFYITSEVKKEIVDIPIQGKRFAFEAMLVKGLIANHCLDVFDTSIYAQETDMVEYLANNIFFIANNPLKILNRGELESLVLAKNINAEAVVVDERTTRLLLETPYQLRYVLQEKFKRKVSINKDNLAEFGRHFSTLKIIRSVELALVSYELGLMKGLLAGDSPQEVVRALLWALKDSGCAIPEREIRMIQSIYKNFVKK